MTQLYARLDRETGLRVLVREEDRNEKPAISHRPPQASTGGAVLARSRAGIEGPVRNEYLAALRGRHAPSTTIKADASDLRPFVNAAPAELSRIDTEAVRAFFRWLVQLELVTSIRWIVWPRPEPWPACHGRWTTSRCGRSWRRSRPAPPATEPTLLYETGMRVGEALSLQRADVDLTPDDEKVRVLGKGGRERTVLLTAAPESIRLLRRHLKASRIVSGSVFRGDARYGGSNLPLSYTVVRQAWRRYCEAA